MWSSGADDLVTWLYPFPKFFYPGILYVIPNIVCTYKLPGGAKLKLLIGVA